MSKEKIKYPGEKLLEYNRTFIKRSRETKEGGENIK